MKTNEQTAEVLNDLIQINNDRIEGYEKASRETAPADADLRALFDNMAAESRDYVNQLTKQVSISGNEPADGTTVKGKIYRAWMDVKATFTGKDRKAILASCEYGEDAAQKAYDQALATDAELPTELRQLITDQKASLRKSHDKIKAMRDAQPA
ncbi:PA2169 family four-helix-bundle protein [Terrimonas sp. NA20]|uniref:PA2169 family four-helix-bundle protein n=1 Tax=Terrimonas ginsenosidimutans TaxID=2908004 RepID=A0ABS9KXY2_9BACT|nr:PA2169 family four-helix-bundle protein [Terrimonas ginsenosidimutans]MCG2617163.1 PA2169 family four-helix-bundle protein [Terrimonas ginsenosidimutans]